MSPASTKVITGITSPQPAAVTYIRNRDVASRAGSSRKMMSLISNRCNGNDHKTAKVVSKNVGPLYSVIRMTLNESANRYIRNLKFNVTTKFHKIIRFL